MSRDPEKLIEPFRTQVKKLIKIANEQGLNAFITGTTRTLAEQKELVRKGYSKTLKSKHLVGEAADIAFKHNGLLVYYVDRYEKLYAIAQKLPYIIWPHKDLGWQKSGFTDRPHFQYDRNKKLVDTNDMNKIEALIIQVKRLQGESRDLTTLVRVLETRVLNFEIALKKEKKEHGETVERAATNYKKWQKQIDVANKAKKDLKFLVQGENSKLQAIWLILKG